LTKTDKESDTMEKACQVTEECLNNNNNNNNYKTSIAPIFLKIIELRGSPSTGVGQSHSQGTMQNSSTNDQMQWKLRRGKQA